MRQLRLGKWQNPPEMGHKCQTAGGSGGERATKPRVRDERWQVSEANFKQYKYSGLRQLADQTSDRVRPITSRRRWSARFAR